MFAKDYMCLKNAILDNIQISCICNTELILTKPYIVYRAAAKCDRCEANIMDFDILFHCPKEKSVDHQMGYDVCLDCAIGNKQNYLLFEKTANKKFKKLDRFQKVIKPEIMMMFEKKKKSIRKKADTITSTLPYIMEIQQMVFKEIMNRINGLDRIPGININADDVNNKSDNDNKDSEEDEDDMEESGFSSDLFVNPADSHSDSDANSNNEEHERRPLLMDRNDYDNNDMMDALSLKQLYFIKNKLSDCFMKHETLTKSLNKLHECVNYKVNDRECEWEQWSADEIVEWILQLENGRFKAYENTLRKELNDGDATGAILPHLDISDWRKSFSIKNWKDATDLNRYKNILVTNKKEEQINMNDENEMPIHVYPSPFDPAEEGADTK